MTYIHGFADLGREDLATAGGKGANLAEMVRAGLNVPPGFVVNTAGYKAFVQENGLQAQIERLAGAAKPEAAGAVEVASEAIRALFDAGSMPAPIAAQVAEAYRALGGGAVAVRSSATAEDLPGASFAGQQETYLNMRGEQQVLEAVRRCWSSLWTPRAIAYRARQGILPGDVALAVVVQRLVPSESAGILFTANPVNGRRDQMVVDAAWGLGEAVVSGLVTPDHWVLDGTTGAVIEGHPARKETMTARTAEGTVSLPVPAELADRPSVDVATLQGLVALGRRVAAHFGAPQDIEWAVEGGEIYLVQSRPITSLFPIPAPAPATEAGLRVYLCVHYIQGFPDPMTPLGISAFRTFAGGIGRLWGYPLARGEHPAAFTVAAGRIYVDATSAIHHPKGRLFVLGVPGMVDRPMVEILKQVIKREPSLTPVTPKLAAKPPVSLFLRAAGRALGTLIAPEWGKRKAQVAIERYYAQLEARAAHLRGPAARMAFFDDGAETLFPTFLGVLLPVVVPAMTARFLAEAKLKKWLGDASGFQPVLRSLAHNPTTEMDLALWRVSRELKAAGRSPSAEDPAVQAFLAEYGHRGVREIDIGMPRWRDDPRAVIEVLERYLSHGEDSDPEAQFRRGAQEAEQAVIDLVAQVRQRKGALRAGVMRLLLSRTRALMGRREYPKFMAVKIFALYRTVIAGAGEELVQAGRLERADDAFFLDLKDLVSDADLRQLAAANRAKYQREIARRAVPRLMTSTGEVFFSAPAEGGGLVGTPASAGVYEGRVRVIRDPRGAVLEPGEVLIAPGTDPAWTPLFLTAGALVMEIGGIMSHGSVVAREYGIPAVVGVAGATELLKTGQRIRVDGEAGRVTVLD